MSSGQRLAAEVLVVVTIVSLRYAGHIPISSTPWLLLAATCFLFTSGRNWRSVGLHGDRAGTDVLIGSILGVLLHFFGTVVQEPFFDWLMNTTQDFSQFEPIRQHMGLLLLMIALSWVLAGFGEEMVYRGYLLTRISEVFGGSRFAVVAGLLLSSGIFAVAHKYQGPSGVLDAGFMGIYYGLVYLGCGRRLLPSVFAHGTNNTIGFIGFYLGFYN